MLPQLLLDATRRTALHPVIHAGPSFSSRGLVSAEPIPVTDSLLLRLWGQNNANSCITNRASVTPPQHEWYVVAGGWCDTIPIHFYWET